MLNKGKIFLFGEIKQKKTLEIIQKLKYLILKNTKKIFIYINSPGGDVDCGTAILDEMQEAIENGIQINTVGCGLAASMAAIILAHGKKRFATQNTTIMLHPISYETGWDYHKYIKKYADFTGKLSENIMRRLAHRCGYESDKDQRKFMTMIDDSIWLNVQDAINFRIIDAVWNKKAERAYEKR